MTQQQLEREVIEVVNDTPETDHYFCETCYPDWDVLCFSLCSLDLTNEPYGHRDDSVKCVVCFDLADNLCPRCGE